MFSLILNVLWFDEHVFVFEKFLTPIYGGRRVGC